MQYEDVILVLRCTRRWIYYGWLVHGVGCALIAAVQGLLLR